jgi:hypothetical protein
MSTNLVALTCGRCGVTGQADPDTIPTGTTVTLCPDCNDYADEVMQAPLYLGSGMVDDGATS